MQYQTNYPYATTSQQYGVGSHPREEQRRRQQEYSQALAQQVAQREQQKRQEREMNQHYGRQQTGAQHPPQFESSERGILDGLGHNNPQNSRTSFVRGQPQLHHRLPEPIDYPQGSSFPLTRVSYSRQALQPPSASFPLTQNEHPVNSQGSSHQQQQQNWQQQSAHTDVASGGVGGPPFVSGPVANVPTAWAQQNLQANSIPQATSSQFWQGQEQTTGYGGYASPQRQSGYPQAEPAGHNGGRRQRTDIHDGGRGDSEEAERLRRKLQQQQEMQLALERQIEEKRQQKLEAKRRQEEEDRREMQRFEEDQRRQRAEQERLQEEKRRKAELEQQKTDQAAAAVAAANQQAKLQQQQKLYAQISQAQPEHPQHSQPFQQQRVHPLQQPQIQQPDRLPEPSSPSRMKNPFTNSRAHLFEDPPPQGSPQRGPIISNNWYGYSNQNASPIQRGPQGFDPGFQQENNVGRRSLDPTELRRQYDDMREELRRQKQCVDQLRQAQAQIQQQQQLSPVRAESGNIPTLMDLEKLRNELRGELDYREQLHKQELASLKREQQQERSLAHSPHRYPGTKNSLELPVRTAPPNNVKRIPPHQAGREAPIAPAYEPKHPTENPIDASLMSLRGESKFVYFDGRVADAGKVVLSSEKGSNGEQGGALGEHSEPIEVKSPRFRRSTHRSLGSLPTKQQSVQHSVASSVLPSLSSVHRNDAGSDSEDESHDFVMQQLTSSPTSRRAAASSHRYSRLPSVLSSPSLSKTSGKWRLESMGTNDASDSDDELDASLDGEQLEALFQRNVRRHEILLGFQCKVHAQTQNSNQQEDEGLPHAKMAWSELHKQLESNRRVSIQRKLSSTSTSSNVSNNLDDQTDEAALVASSKWMPSSLLLSTAL